MQRALSLLAVAALSAALAHAQDAKPSHMGGTLESVSGQTLVFKSGNDQDISVNLPAGLKIMADAHQTVADIKPGDFLAVTSAKDPDGKLHAKDIHILPESMRGVGEGHRDMSPGMTMTNATVSGIAGIQQAGTLTLKYKDGSVEVAVAPATPVSRLIPATPDQLKAGATVNVIAAKQGDGFVATFVSVR